MQLEAVSDAESGEGSAMETQWTVRIDRLETQLKVGIYEHEKVFQPILVSLKASGRADASPNHIEQCIDYEPICAWIQNEWPNSNHTPLLETRMNELLSYVFSVNSRITWVWAGLYKPNAIKGARFVGLERSASRAISAAFESRPVPYLVPH